MLSHSAQAGTYFVLSRKEGMEMEKLVLNVKHQLEQWKEWHNAKSVMIAISGGVDSVVLFDIISQINQELAQPKRLVIAHFNHNLRSESGVDADFVKEIATQNNLVYYIQEWANPATRNIEAAAREARYRFFAEIIEREQIDVLLTGHHLNDLAETVLMRLTRGTSLRGLRGIEPNYRRLLMTNGKKSVHVQMMRPLLKIPKATLLEYACEQGLMHVEDSSNQDMKFFRNRIRNQILPVFEQENPSFLENMLMLQEQLQASYRVHYASYLKAEPMLLMYSEQLKWVLYVPGFTALSSDQRRVYLAIFFEERLIEDIPSYTKEAIERVDQLIMNDRLPNSSFQINDQWIARREYDYIYIQPKIEQEVINITRKIQLNQLNHWYNISETEQVGLFDERRFLTAEILEMEYYLRLYLKPDQLQGFYLRHRQEGDRLELNDGQGDVFHKKVSRYMIDQKIPMSDRSSLWLLCDRSNEVISIVGHIASRHYRMRHPMAQQYLFLYRKIQD